MDGTQKKIMENHRVAEKKAEKDLKKQQESLEKEQIEVSGLFFL